MEISVQDYARECAEQGLRGDYSACRSDFTVEQDYAYSRPSRRSGASCAIARPS